MSFNWADILMAAIFLKGLYSARKNDFMSEIYHFVGALLATFITLHYFLGFGVYLAKHFFVPNLIQESFAFCLLAGLTVFFFFVSQGGWKALLKVNAPNFLEKWGSLTLSILRSFLYCGLVYLALAMFDNGIVSRDVKSAFSSPVFKNVSIATYSFTFERVVKPLFRKEKFNDRVYHIISPPEVEIEAPENESLVPNEGLY
ncbi:MAG: CvpA family protein [Candidatus Omnitrophota bacterium]